MVAQQKVKNLMEYHSCKMKVTTSLLQDTSLHMDPLPGRPAKIQNEYVQSDQQAFYYLEKAVDQLHPGALYLLGAVYLTGDCVKKDVGSALWCFHRASQKGHAGAAIAYGSLLLTGVELPESITRFYVKRGSSRRNGVDHGLNPIELAREQFEIAAKAGSDLGFRWLQRLEEEVKRLQRS